jgi:GNAT superfamily N-acetyltransferase
MVRAIFVRPVEVEKILRLRHAVLRAGLPLESASFEGDAAEDSIHLAALDGSSVVGCLTLHLNQWNREPAWQLRGMAVDPSYQRSGVGELLMQAAEAQVREVPVPRLLWCNARVPAIGFYRKMGWEVVSEQFEIPTAGPHVKMIRRLAIIPQ